MTFMWADGYSDYHPELPGGSAAGRTCECKPFDASRLGAHRSRLRPGVMEASGLPMPVTGADYKWLNLIARTPRKALWRGMKAMAIGVGGLALKREYIAGGQALAAGLFAGAIRAGIPIWTDTSLVRLPVGEDGAVTGAVVDRDGVRTEVTARRGVVLAAGGFDHDTEMRRKYQSDRLVEHASLGCDATAGRLAGGGPRERRPQSRGGNLVTPVDECIREVPMMPVECRQCGARVLARKSSWAQTSIQWDAESSAACVERHAAGALSDAAMRDCSQLRESIWAAAESGDLRVLDRAAR